MTITIKTDNAAFEGENKSYEIARILQELATKIENGNMSPPVMDINGNKVGTVRGS
jgi:hypothetical protein